MSGNPGQGEEDLMKEQSLSDKQILSHFLSGMERMQTLVGDLPASDLDLPSEPGGWTIRQIIHHVTDDCDVWSMCIKKAIATPGALIRFEGFPGNEAWATALDFDRRETGPALNLIRAHRHYLAELLRHFSDVWDRSVRLANAEGEVVQEMSVRQMVKMLADHMVEHSETIDKLISARTNE